MREVSDKIVLKRVNVGIIRELEIDLPNKVIKMSEIAYGREKSISIKVTDEDIEKIKAALMHS